jgi:hypothetical protein
MCGRSTLVIGCASLLLACGGGSDEGDTGEDLTPVPTAVGSVADLTDSENPADDGQEGTGDEITTAEVEGARLRFVNLFRDNGEGVAIDVWWGTDLVHPAEPALTVEYGTASDYVTPVLVGGPFGEPSGDVRVFYTRRGENPEQYLVTEEEPLQSGDQVTFLVGKGPHGTEERPAYSSTYYEESSWTEGLPEVPTDGVAVFVNEVAVAFSENEGDLTASQLGLADGSGCLVEQEVSLGAIVGEGTPGAAIADFGESSTCEGAPLSEPVTLGDPGTRVVAFPFNDGATRRLLLLDIP